MKFTEKFALIPIERYNLLYRDNIAQKGAGESGIKTGGEGTEINDSGGTGTEKSDSPKSEAETISPQVSPTVHEKYKPIVSAVNKKNKPIVKKTTVDRKNKAIPKYPALPPGIPNKVKTIDFKWVKLF